MKSYKGHTYEKTDTTTTIHVGEEGSMYMKERLTFVYKVDGKMDHHITSEVKAKEMINWILEEEEV